MEKLGTGRDKASGPDDHHFADEGAGAVGNAGVVEIRCAAPEASRELGVGFGEASFEELEGEAWTTEAVLEADGFD